MFCVMSFNRQSGLFIKVGLRRKPKPATLMTVRACITNAHTYFAAAWRPCDEHQPGIAALVGARKLVLHPVTQRLQQREDDSPRTQRDVDM